MKRKISAILTTILAVSLVFSVYQPSNAAPYYDHDGSVDEKITKYKVEKLTKKDYWYYAVKVCADDYTMGIAGVILKSDMDKKVLGIKKTIKKGDCKVYGAVMKAKNGDTLGGELVENHEAIQKMIELKKDVTKLPKSQFNEAIKEWSMYYWMSGFNPR